MVSGCSICSIKLPTLLNFLQSSCPVADRASCSAARGLYSFSARRSQWCDPSSLFAATQASTRSKNFFNAGWPKILVPLGRPPRDFLSDVLVGFLSGFLPFEQDAGGAVAGLLAGLKAALVGTGTGADAGSDAFLSTCVAAGVGSVCCVLSGIEQTCELCGGSPGGY
jgi:hypothetical protein